MYPFVGEIRAFGFNFAPRGWFFCDGRLLSLSSYTPLFAIIGTTYGGNGTTNFAIPNLQGQVPMHWGTGPGGFTTQIGEGMGTTGVTLLQTQIPQHTHQAVIATGAATDRSATPTNASFLGDEYHAGAYQASPVTANTPFSPRAISPAGSNIAHENQQPYLAVTFCIAYEGVFPQRS